MNGYYLTTVGGDIAVLPDGKYCKIQTSQLTATEEHGLRTALKKFGVPIPTNIGECTIPVNKKLGTVAKVLRNTLKAGREVITVFKDTAGKINEITMEDVERVVAQDKPVATVEKPQRGCPFPHSPAPRDVRATDALLKFLDANQIATFQNSGAVVVRGGHTGYRYLLAHRHSEKASQMQSLVRCHDTGISYCVGDVTGLPASEEMLALVCMLSIPEREKEFLRG
jgi:hypothetical protein